MQFKLKIISYRYKPIIFDGRNYFKKGDASQIKVVSLITFGDILGSKSFCNALFETVT